MNSLPIYLKNRLWRYIYEVIEHETLKQLNVELYNTQHIKETIYIP